jgi:hypothetical protein
VIRERVMPRLARAKARGTRLGRQRLEDTDADKVAAIAPRARRVAATARLLMPGPASFVLE